MLLFILLLAFCLQVFSSPVILDSFNSHSITSGTASESDIIRICEQRGTPIEISKELNVCPSLVRECQRRLDPKNDFLRAYIPKIEEFSRIGYCPSVIAAQLKLWDTQVKSYLDVERKFASLMNSIKDQKLRKFEQQIRHACELLLQGKSCHKVASETNLNRYVLGEVKRCLAPDPSDRLTLIEPEILELHKSNIPICHIAKRVNASFNIVAAIVDVQPIKPILEELRRPKAIIPTIKKHKQHKVSEFEIRIICNLILKNKSDDEIVKETGLSNPFITECRRRLIGSDLQPVENRRLAIEMDSCSYHYFADCEKFKDIFEEIREKGNESLLAGRVRYCRRKKRYCVSGVQHSSSKWKKRRKNTNYDAEQYEMIRAICEDLVNSVCSTKIIADRHGTSEIHVSELRRRLVNDKTEHLTNLAQLFRDLKSIGISNEDIARLNEIDNEYLEIFFELESFEDVTFEFRRNITAGMFQVRATCEVESDSSNSSFTRETSFSPVDQTPSLIRETSFSAVDQNSSVIRETPSSPVNQNSTFCSLENDRTLEEFELQELQEMLRTPEHSPEPIIDHPANAGSGFDIDFGDVEDYFRNDYFNRD